MTLADEIRTFREEAVRAMLDFPGAAARGARVARYLFRTEGPPRPAR